MGSTCRLNASARTRLPCCELRHRRRNPNAGQLNLSVSRDFKFNLKEHPLTFQVRGDVLNVMNHSFLGGVGTNVTSGVGTFGAITSGSTVLNRFIQIQGHIRW